MISPNKFGHTGFIVLSNGHPDRQANEPGCRGVESQRLRCGQLTAGPRAPDVIAAWSRGVAGLMIWSFTFFLVCRSLL